MWKKIAVAVLATVLVLPLQPASALENEDLLAMVAMPLAVAAVSEVTDVPLNELMDVVTLLNDAAVPPPQFIEVMRYVPVALVAGNDEPDFVEFVRIQRQEGLTGTALVTSIEERMRIYELDDINLDVTRLRVVDITEDFIPVVVRNRVAEVRSHPHGGPPGQLKKAAGVQTGAEIVHGSSRGRSDRVKDDRKNRGGGVVSHDRGNSGKGNKGKGKGKG